MSWNKIAALTEEQIQERGITPIYDLTSSLRGESKIAGYEGFKIVSPAKTLAIALEPDAAEPDKKISIIQSMGGGFDKQYNATWTYPTMTAFCRYHHECTANKYCDDEWCHRGVPEVNQGCDCGVYGHPNLERAIAYMGSGKQDWKKMIVRLAHHGRLEAGTLGFKSYKATLTGIIMPELPDWLKGSEASMRRGLTKIAGLYRVPLIEQAHIKNPEELEKRNLTSSHQLYNQGLEA